MASRTVVVGSSSGLHARPAALVSQAAAAAAPAVVLIGRPGEDGVNASSVLLLMSLGIGAGEEVVLASDDEAALGRLAELVATDLDAS